MDNKSIFAKNLKRQMELNRKTRRDVCAALGFSYYTFSDWVNGKKYPRMDKVEMLADYFGVLKSDLIEEQKEQPTVNDDELSEDMKKLISRLKKLPEDKIRMLLDLAESIQPQDH